MLVLLAPTMCVCVCLSTGASEKTDFAHFAVLKLRICCTLEGYFERKEVLSVVVFKQADLERAKKKKKKCVHARGPSVLRSAAGSPQNGSLWGDSLEALWVYAVCVLACVFVMPSFL